MEALASELQEHGVTVSTLCPGPTTSEFGEVAGFPDSTAIDRFKMDAASVARSSVLARSRPPRVTTQPGSPSQKNTQRRGFELLYARAILVLEPGATETAFQQVAGEIAHPGEPAYQVVGVALDALGRQPSVVSGWWNWLRANAATRLLPRSLVAYIARDVMAKQTPADMR